MKPKASKQTHAQPLIEWRRDRVLDPSHELFRLAQAVPMPRTSSFTR